jgi:hypothetical protein
VQGLQDRLEIQQLVRENGHWKFQRREDPRELKAAER